MTLSTELILSCLYNKSSSFRKLESGSYPTRSILQVPSCIIIFSNHTLVLPSLLAAMAQNSLVSNSPLVVPNGPVGAFMVELLIFNGSPFKDHWRYWVRCHTNPDIGVELHATGDVRNGFEFEIKRSYDLKKTCNQPTTSIPLQWVDAKYFDKKAMLNDGVQKFDNVPVCDFERSAHKVKVPDKSLNSASNAVSQSWVEDMEICLIH